MRIAIAGFDVEGRASAEYFANKGAEVTVLDNKTDIDVPPEFEKRLGDDCFNDVAEFDLVVRTPSLNPKKIASTKKVTTATKEFFANCPAPIIGVTGTKGKGTTCTLISEMLTTAGKRAHLVGNIGVPALGELSKISPDDFVVFELSSFQLWDLDVSPHIAVVLMIEPDHLDTHDSPDDYLAAKANIVRYQTNEDMVIHHPSNALVAELIKVSPAKKFPYQTEQGAHIQAGSIVIDGQTVCAVDEVGLLGEHNLENICAAITAVWQLTQDVSAIAEVVKSFTGLPFHTELVYEKGGVKYFNDSFSTAPAAAVAATRAVPGAKIVIYGGYNKGADLMPIAEVAKTESVKKVLLIGQTAPIIAKHMQSVGFSSYEIMTGDFAATVARAAELAKPGDSVVLSPGCASFDMFKNYKDRGEAFNRLVNGL